ncbi:MAG: pyridoxal-phosphate dependent enzyme [Pirellulaceae bacterium]
MIGMNEIRTAHERIADHIRRTPVVHDAVMDETLGAEVYLKCENLQEAGAFKSRGACNAVFSLSDEEARHGVVTHSSGNHAAALARAAARRGIPAFIVMPSTARPQKVQAVRLFGGQITFCEPTLADRERTAQRVMAETGATLVHPYDDDRIIAGQGTAALELLEEVSGLSLIITPVGGGGLLSGTALYAKALQPAIQVWGAEPRGADDAYRSWKSGVLVPSVQPQTIADGLLTSLGERNFAIISALVDNILLAGDDAIVRAVRWVYELTRMVVEPSGVVPLAALQENRIDLGGRRVGIILSGGNFDLTDLPVME